MTKRRNTKKMNQTQSKIPQHPLLEYPLINSTGGAFAFTTTRHGGVSEGKYASFNCNHYCGDSPEHVSRNRELLIGYLGGKADCMVVPHQTHLDNIRVIDKNYFSLTSEQQAECIENTDALITSISGVCICVSTADCVPVCLYSEESNIAAVIHAGWRGTCLRIVEKTIDKLVSEFNVAPNSIKAVIGPCISFEAFEVGEEVYDKFHNAGFDMQTIADRNANTGKWHIDLKLANVLQLEGKGVDKNSIYVSPLCTFSNPDHLFSARKSGTESGRMLTGITILK